MAIPVCPRGHADEGRCGVPSRRHPARCSPASVGRRVARAATPRWAWRGGVGHRHGGGPRGPPPFCLSSGAAPPYGISAGLTSTPRPELAVDLGDEEPPDVLQAVLRELPPGRVSASRPPSPLTGQGDDLGAWRPQVSRRDGGSAGFSSAAFRRYHRDLSGDGRAPWREQLLHPTGGSRTRFLLSPP